MELPKSILTKKQIIPISREYKEKGTKYHITVTLRYDDECENGHNTFAITADIKRFDGTYWREDMSGCCHEEIARHFPALEKYIKWHLTSSDGPMHYVANSMYHALEHGAKYAYVYYNGQIDPLGIFEQKEILLGYIDADKAKKAEGVTDYRVEWDKKTVKTANLYHARSCAVWPEATAEDFTKEKLEARLPKLMQEFKADMEEIGFVY
jgi:hypothetical protein